MISATVTLGDGGRILIPSNIRKELGLEAGNLLTIVSGNGEIRILPSPSAPAVLRDEADKGNSGIRIISAHRDAKKPR